MAYFWLVFWESKTAVGRSKPNFSKCGGDSPHLWSSTAWLERQGVQLWAWPGCLHLLALPRDLGWNQRFSTKVALCKPCIDSPSWSVLSPKNVHCKAVLGTQSGMTRGWGQLVQLCRTRTFEFSEAHETSGRDSDGHQPLSDLITFAFFPQTLTAETCQ